MKQIQHKAKAFAQESVYLEWQKAANNVGKAADVLRLFTDSSVDPEQPFGRVREQALSMLPLRELESVCLFLNDQKRSVEEALWQYYDQREALRTGLLRSLFLCLHFEGNESGSSTGSAAPASSE